MLKNITKLCFWLFLVAILQACPDDNPKTGPISNYSPTISVGPTSIIDPDSVEDENTAYVEVDLSRDAFWKMQELMRIYHRPNGSVERGKVARMLNEAGFLKENGEEFRRRDIPKYDN